MGNIRKFIFIAPCCFSGSSICLRYALHATLLVAVLTLSSGCTTRGGGPDQSEPVKRYKKSNAKYHKVRKGDTLYAISFKAGVDFKTLAAWNGLRKPYTIYPGQVLRLYPTKKRATAASSKGSKNKITTASSSKGAKKSNPSRSKPKQKPGQPEGKLKWAWPTKGKVVSHYSKKDALKDGIKISGKKKQSIRAAESGKVVYVGSGLVGYGKLIIIKHNNTYLSAYGLNDKLLVKEGDSVERYQEIARMGTDHSGNPMLHFEIRRSGKPVDPILYLPR